MKSFLIIPKSIIYLGTVAPAKHADGSTQITILQPMTADIIFDKFIFKRLECGRFTRPISEVNSL